MTESNIATLLIDVGGTNVRIAQLKGNTIIDTTLLKSKDYKSATELLEAYLHNVQKPVIETILIGAAGPVVDQETRLTNIDFKISSAELRSRYPEAKVSLFNDLWAVAHCLKDNPISSSVEAIIGQIGCGNGRRIVIVPGTGLGVAVLLSEAEGAAVIDTEAGHIRAAPLGSDMIPLFAAFFSQQNYISAEHLISGPGILRLFNVLTKITNHDSNGIDGINSPEDVVKAAEQNAEGIAGKALQLFTRILGSYCGDLAIAYKASGGVFLAGKIVKSVSDYIKSNDFEGAFFDRGPMSSMIKGIPVAIIRSDQPVIEGLRSYNLKHGKK